MHIRRIIAAGTALATALFIATPASALAASPAAHNGRIAFVYRGAIETMSQSGAGLTQLATGGAYQPRWSPDGKTIAFQKGGDIWVMQANGSGQKQLTHGGARDITPDWSPNGKQIVFVRSSDGSNANRQLYVMPAGGGTGTLLDPTPGDCPFGPTWSASGTYVVYSDLCDDDADTGSIRKVQLSTGQLTTVVPTSGITAPGGPYLFYGTTIDVTPDGRSVVWEADNGSSDVAVTDLSGGNFRLIYQGGDDCCFAADDPAVSPDGTKVVLTAGDDNPQLDVVNTSGSGPTRVPIDNLADFPLQADWQPRG